MKQKLIVLVAFSAALSAFSAEYYVDASRPDDSGAGTNWPTAKQTIQAAVDLTIDGDTVWVTNGIYDTGGSVTPGYTHNNRVVITNDIIVCSVNGSPSTIIKGGFSIRGVYMSRGVLSGFTITSGHIYMFGDGNGNYDHSGGGVNLYGGSGVVSNCMISGNRAEFYGGGSHGGLLSNCVISNNLATWGGGSSAGMLNRCKLTENLATLGGGSYGGELANCILSGNSADSGGSGSCQGTLINCTLSDNSASSTSFGGGVLNGTLKNCIIWGNSGGNYSAIFPPQMSYCCTTPNPGGIGNITSTPNFVDAANGDFRLQSNSLCINAGNNTYAPAGIDLAGNPRIIGGTVDMGAYEFYIGTDDFDEDGLPNEWEAEYFGTITTASTNTICANSINTIRQAYIAGLDPTDPDSRFAASLDSNQILRWNATSGRVYSVWCSTNLLSGFQCLETNIPWTSGQFDGTTNTSQQLFYKIDVQLEDDPGASGGGGPLDSGDDGDIGDNDVPGTPI